MILIGPPGSGKTSIGKLLAKKKNLIHVDTDQEIETRTGRKISDIFLEDGESGFRKIEREVVLESLELDSAVISLGGGSILDGEVSKKLENEKCVVYLEVSISNAAPRVGFNTDRPLLVANPRQQWLRLFEQRRDIYESLGKFRVSTDNKKPKLVVEEILELIS
ncbi:MAG TPA: shikimate kinase [Candidatus Nanopelagicaceae bacterium]